MNEFDVIQKYFAPLGSDGLRNDAAVLSVPPGHELVVTSDTLNAGTHFLEEAGPADIARKALRVNLSDLAAMGAVPLAYQLNIAFPGKPDERWLQAFAGALKTDQESFGITCSGGDTTTIKGPLSISITAMGTVPEGTAVPRSEAREGDAIVLTGPVGDAWVGLQVLRGMFQTPDDEYFIRQYYSPRPRLDLAKPLREHAQAAIDVSDGFCADLGHLCRQSGLQAHVTLAAIPFSAPARALLEAGTVSPQDLLTGGDDYQLVIACASGDAGQFGGVVGTFVQGDARKGASVIVKDEEGTALDFKHTGWSHF